MKKPLLSLILFISSFKYFLAGPLNTQIIGGQPVSSGQLPWQVILKTDSTDELLCGGSIIASQWVLTAAHCTYGHDSVFLMFGTIQRNISTTVSMTSTQIYIHPDYNPAVLNNDVSLIQLPSALTFSPTIESIPLVSASQENDSFIGTIAFIAGYGVTDDENLDYSDVLLDAAVVIIENSICAADFGSSVVVESTLCAEGVLNTNNSICSGDSGGPLITKTANGTYIQIGINSFVAQDACAEGHPSGYVRLTSFLNYIQNITDLNFD